MQARRLISLAVWTALSAASIFMHGGCARRHAAYDELYARLTEEPGSLDWSVLEGRSIVIDPGHGGYFRGVIGPDSLAEADVNLGVALNLWGLLEEAGAAIVLTRSTDRDFLPEGSTELRDDLEGRIRRANEQEADVFISIHHNANLPVDRAVNKIEVYYRGDDPDASLDLAEDLRLHLARNLGIENAEVKTGNYYILRNSRSRASILGEASYLSHPGVEQRLKLAEKQRLEAEAYFLGLIAYFSRGIPSIGRLAPACDTIDSPTAIVLTVQSSCGVPIDPASAVVMIGSVEKPSFYDAATGTIHSALEADAPNGSYPIRATIRSVAGGTAVSAPFTLQLRRPARFLLPLPVGSAPDGGGSCRVAVLDELGRSVADGTATTATSLVDRRTIRGGSAGGVFSFDVPREIAAGHFFVEADGLADTIRFDGAAMEGARTLLVVDAATGAAVRNPAVILGDGAATRGDARGLVALPLQEGSDSVIVTAPGYRPAMHVTAAGDEAGRPSGCEVVRLDPIFGGILRGVRIALDPGGGGSDHGGIGPRKHRGARINLDVAKRLRDMLESTGALVTLTRRGEETIGEAERIFRINSSGADLAIGIHHDGGAAACRITHYPGSARGTALACSLATALQGIPPCRQYAVLETASPLLQQTSCPACEIHAGSVIDAPAETALSNFLYAYFAAERMLSAIVRYYGGAGDRWLSRTVRVLRSGVPVGGAAVCIDQTACLITDEDGGADFTCIDAGTHAVTIEPPAGARRELRFIEITSGGGDLITIELLP